MLEVVDTKLEGVKIIKPLTIHEDFRGYFVELYNKKEYDVLGNIEFTQDDMSISTHGVLRGLHGDMVTHKLISCLVGRIYIVVLNRETEKWISCTLSEHNRLQLLVPPGNALGHLVMSDHAILHYKQSSYYDRSSQFTIAWNNPRYNIYWPINSPILSERDAIIR